ncbi:DUF302 domain-containing protein [Undibacterium sp.]|uniref:DUF302 domain-containing protein n=1 Tax=Undibacterium sp. TaxID=1914977 RepID=UPI00374CAACF
MLAQAKDEGIVNQQSRFTVEETMQRLEAAARSKGMLIFASINFAGDARKAGLDMHDSQLLVFGNPKAGTPIMQAAPTAALDLPLKVLAWQDAEGKVWVSYNTPAYLGERHHLAPELVKPLEGISNLVNQALQ